jgi:hypothetical protein
MSSWCIWNHLQRRRRHDRRRQHFALVGLGRGLELPQLLPLRVGGADGGQAASHRLQGRAHRRRHGPTTRARAAPAAFQSRSSLLVPHHCDNCYESGEYHAVPGSEGSLPPGGRLLRREARLPREPPLRSLATPSDIEPVWNSPAKLAARFRGALGARRLAVPVAVTRLLLSVGSTRCGDHFDLL